jgi:hypothetical protein
VVEIYPSDNGHSILKKGAWGMGKEKTIFWGLFNFDSFIDFTYTLKGNCGAYRKAEEITGLPWKKAKKEIQIKRIEVRVLAAHKGGEGK